MMRVLHVATSSAGGAGIAATRICEAERSCGVRASISFRRASEDPSGQGFQGLQITRRQSLQSRGVTLLNRVLTREPSALFTPWGTSPCDRELSEVTGIDVLHIHNFYNMVSLQNLSALPTKASVVMTLHDERALTAGCHTSLGCEGFLGTCHPCPQSRIGNLVPHRSALSRQRESLLRHVACLYVPSKWMLNQVLKTGWPPNRVRWIPNPIDSSVFRPAARLSGHTVDPPPQASERWVIGWLPGKLEMEFWAGFRVFRDLLAVRQPGVLPIVLTTSEVEAPADIPAQYVPPPQSERARAQFWATADVAVSVTKADNFPNVVLEALAVGTPICISDVGGATEAVRHSGGGIPITGSCALDVAQALLTAYERYSDGAHGGLDFSKIIRDQYNYRRIGMAYLEHYRSLLRER